jgi:hypothetical protein
MIQKNVCIACGDTIERGLAEECPDCQDRLCGECCLDSSLRELENDQSNVEEVEN